MGNIVLTGPQTVTLFCAAPDGTSVTATLNYNAGTGALTGMTVVNTSSRSARVVLAVSGVERNIAALAGTRSYTANQIRTSWGLTNMSQLGSVGVVGP